VIFVIVVNEKKEEQQKTSVMSAKFILFSHFHLLPILLLYKSLYTNRLTDNGIVRRYHAIALNQTPSTVIMTEEKKDDICPLAERERKSFIWMNPASDYKLVRTLLRSPFTHTIRNGVQETCTPRWNTHIMSNQSITEEYLRLEILSRATDPLSKMPELKDVMDVCLHANCYVERAIATLKKHNNDPENAVVNAVIDITFGED
jgi:hypothetical protein